MKNLKFLLLLASASIIFVSCSQKTNKKNKDSDKATDNVITTVTQIVTQGNGGNGGGSGDGDPNSGDDPGTGDQIIEYHKLNNPYIVLHGPLYYQKKGSIGPNNEIILWSSEKHLQGISESAFETDNRFNIRIIPRNNGATIDSQGYSCHYNWQPFQKLQIQMRVRKKGSSSFGSSFVFEASLDDPSKVKEFDVPLNNTGPLVVEILSAKWDWSCQDKANQGYPNVEGMCPWDDVWENDCVALELQFATDWTKDIPGDRY